MIDQKDITIIIPHLGHTSEQRRSLTACRESLQETCESKIIIAINGIGDGDQFDFTDKPEQIEMMALEAQGQCKAVNAAVATTNTPWIFITNDDMIYAEGWIERLLDTPGLAEDILCLSPQLVEPTPGAPTFQVKFFGGAGGDFNMEGWKEFAIDYMENGEGEVRTGLNFPVLIRRDLWDLVGGYDINYDPWGSNSDSDLEYKIKLAGIQPMQTTKCIVYHFSQTSGTFEPRNDSFRYRNYAYFKEKFGFDRTDNGIWEANFKIPTKEEGRIFLPEWEGKYGKVH